MSECAECARLEKAKKAARAVGDRSAVSDCIVLLGRHPDHDKPLADPEAS